VLSHSTPEKKKNIYTQLLYYTSIQEIQKQSTIRWEISPFFFTLKMYVQCIKVQSIAIGPRTLKKLQICSWAYYNLQYFYTLYDVKNGGISYVNVVSISIHVLV
jgi:hypothetical protein